ncbi:hypothetical protein ACQEVY_25295 [Streptomyces sp. CA-288835]|uniref:hypothetical protein n=1 Tax=Streptomyces sp. CA-288835 TaxID=3240069 RepID=UPI003D941156
MKNTRTGGLVLAKVTRRHTLILGKSQVLERDSVVQLRDGRVGLHYVRRNGETGFIPFPFTSFDDLVTSKREFEREYITGEVVA